ncbi:glycosyltransferase family 2 protein [Alloprevotella tannerae]
MNRLPKVTVITVCRNALPLLRHTVENVLQQTYAPLEYLIIDGASTDGTPAYLSSLQAPLQWWSAPDKGIYDAMNKGVARASGEWVIFMNAGDCFAATDVLQRIFSTPRTADVIYGDVLKAAADGAPVLSRAHPFKNAHRMCFCHQSSLVLIECLRATPFDITHPFSADFKFFKLLGHQGKKFAYVDFPIALFDTSGISNRQRSKGLYDNIKVVNETDSFLERLRLLPRLWFVYLLCRLRGK